MCQKITTEHKEQQNDYFIIAFIEIFKPKNEGLAKYSKDFAELSNDIKQLSFDWFKHNLTNYEYWPKLTRY